MKKILGLNAIGFNTSASLIINGKIVGAIEEERLNREKRTRKFPILSIKYLLSQNKINLQDLDCICVSWNPLINLEKYQKNFNDNIRHIPEILYSIPGNIFNLSSNINEEYIKQTFQYKKKNIDIFYVNHHLSHASNYFFSGFKNASILTTDAFGEKQSSGMYIGKKNEIKKIFSQNFPNSLGSFYSTFTEYCGFRPQNDEWKLMGAAAYGKRTKTYDKLRALVNLKQDGSFELDLNYFNFYNFHRPKYYNKRLIRYLGLKPNQNPWKLKNAYYDLAFASQSVFEEIYLNMINGLYKKNKKIKNLVVSGGSALNSLANGRILKSTEFENLFIPPVPDDSGAGLGAASFVNNVIYKKKIFPMKNNYLGPQFSDIEIEKTLKLYKIKFRKIKNVCAIAAKSVSDKKIVGWFQGKLEFGDRALGNRSIIADPRDKKIKDKINDCVKYREKFRPFAPAILEEYCSKYFYNHEKSIFMEKALKIKKAIQRKIPAVVHNDGTGRLQSVNKENNLKFYNLIDEYRKLTGIPLVLNTSLNYQGDPIACKPEDAIKTFYLSGLDLLYINNFELYK
tara:strand:- start:458 stop:2155 length:1698 start_codon:yes stop_codon:yes gene_type:complete